MRVLANAEDNGVGGNKNGQDTTQSRLNSNEDNAGNSFGRLREPQLVDEDQHTRD